MDLSPAEQQMVREGMESLGWNLHYFDSTRRKPDRCHRCMLPFSHGDEGYSRAFQGFEGGKALLYCCVDCASHVCEEEGVFERDEDDEVVSIYEDDLES